MQNFLYHGFEIRSQSHRLRNHVFYYIFKDGEHYSLMALASPRAACNVLNTHLGIETFNENDLILLEN